MKSIWSFLVLISLILVLIYFVLNIRQYGLREGARSGRTSSSSTTVYITKEELLNKINGNAGAIKKLKERLDAFGDINKRLKRVENKTRELPED